MFRVMSRVRRLWSVLWIALALAIGAGIALWQKRRADIEAATALAVSEFLQNDLLSQAGPGTKPDPDLKVRTALDRAARRITQKFGRQPLVEVGPRMSHADIAFKEIIEGKLKIDTSPQAEAGLE